MKKVLIIVFVVVILLITLLTVLLLNRKLFLKHSVSDTLVFNEEYSTVFDEISIETDASDIEIKEATDSKIKLVIYGDAERTNVNKNDKTLSIKTTQKKCSFFCWNTKISKIELYLPKNYSKKINIENKFGDISIGKFSKLNLDIKSNAGDVTITESNKITAKLDYGDIEIDKVNEYLDIKNSCGDIKVNSLNLEKDSTIHNNLGDIKIGTTNKIYIDAKTELGDVKINNNYNDSDITLTIKNDCGSIKVNN